MLHGLVRMVALAALVVMGCWVVVRTEEVMEVLLVAAGRSCKHGTCSARSCLLGHCCTTVSTLRSRNRMRYHSSTPLECVCWLQITNDGGMLGADRFGQPVAAVRDCPHVAVCGQVRFSRFHVLHLLLVNAEGLTSLAGPSQFLAARILVAQGGERIEPGQYECGRHHCGGMRP